MNHLLTMVGNSIPWTCSNISEQGLLPVSVARGCSDSVVITVLALNQNLTRAVTTPGNGGFCAEGEAVFDQVHQRRAIEPKRPVEYLVAHSGRRRDAELRQSGLPVGRGRWRWLEESSLVIMGWRPKAPCRKVTDPAE